MKEGLLWFDNDPQRKLIDKIDRAARRYQARFGQKPTTCYVNSADLEEGTQEYAGIRLMPVRNIQRHHIWLGVEHEGITAKAA